MQKYTTEELQSKNKILNKPPSEVYLVLDNIRSMYNVGAIFRTCDAVGISGLFLCGITAYPPRKEIEKTAIKTVENVPWKYFPDTIEAIKELKKDNITVLALEQCKESINYLNYTYRKPLAIIVGNEVTGVSEEALSLCDYTIDIPMYGVANSLNVATAVGIILYKATEPRHND